jgi:beta-galactosidase
VYFGADYYPEQWNESCWETDLSDMRDMHFNMVRIAEFAWCRLEPQDGAYEFSWLDRFIDLCGKYDFKVMLGIPARNVPAWLFKKDPEMAIQAYEGHRESFGTRYTTCLSNKTLQNYVIRLTRAMGERYMDDPRVYAWHLDNEYGDASLCYCEDCRQVFISWLRAKYKTLKNLNKTWGLVFWSLELTDWEQVWLPRKGNHFQKHPSLLQDFFRFNSWKTEEMVRQQADILRRIAPAKLVTTNIQSSTRDHTDYYRMCKPLDWVSTNFYPPAGYNTVDLDICRGLKQKNFWVVEQKSGSPGSQTNSWYSARPGETRLNTYQSLAHGADLLLYFRWRPVTYAQEQFYMGIMNYDGSKNRISREIDAVGAELAGLADELAGTQVKNDLAMIYSFDSRWADRYYKPNPEINYRNEFLRYYSALEQMHFGIDIVSPSADLSQYKVVVIPYLYLADEAIVDNIASYVERGGTIIVSPRCGAKDEYARMEPTHIPPKLAQVLGIRIEEVLSLEPTHQGDLFMQNGSVYRLSRWAELLQPTTSKVLARYGSDWYEGYAAITCNVHGKGLACYIGTMPETTFLVPFIDPFLREAGVGSLVEGAPAIQACERVNAFHRYTFLLNNATSCNMATVSPAGIDLLTGQEIGGTILLKPFDVLILKRNIDG